MPATDAPIDLGTAQVVRRPIASPLNVVEALRSCRDDVAPFCFSGAWAGGGALIGSEPVRLADESTGDDPFALIASLPSLPSRSAGDDHVVGGGWFGYLGYGLGRSIERLPPSPPRPAPLPTWSLAFYDHLLHLDADGRWWFEALWTDGRSSELERRHDELAHRVAGRPAPPRPFRCGPFSSHPDRAHHLDAVAEALESIRAGDIYQANLGVRLEAAIEGAGLDLFAQGVEALEPRYAAYLARPGLEVASFSPELFLARTGREVLSSPIKGTRDRPDDPLLASLELDQLERSAKDHAENVMIVDLVRNDLGRVCRPGSIGVPEIARAEAHPGVWHLVSDVVGTLEVDRDDGDLVRAAFPPGSVTGAPKVRAMEIIAAREPTGREVYTGAIGYVSPVAGLELNVAIRTFERAGDRVWLGVGGGVVVDSTPAAEHRECLIKARPLLAAIGAVLATDRDDHDLGDTASARQASLR